MVLGITSVVYAWTLSGISSLDTGLVTVTGESKTSSDLTCDTMKVNCGLYRNNYNVNNGNKTASGVKSLSVTAKGTNLPGQQNWEVFGSHQAERNGNKQSTTSYAQTLH